MEGIGGATAAMPSAAGGSNGSNGGGPAGLGAAQWSAAPIFNAGDLQPPGQQGQQQPANIHQQILQQQHLMQLAAAAAASGQGQQPLNSMLSAAQAPTINMMIQGMANQGMGPPHGLQSPSNSGPAGVGPGFLVLQQPGMPHPQAAPRDISPGSTPGLVGPHPPPAQTPPNMMPELNDRNWIQQPPQQPPQQPQQPQQNVFIGGGRIMNPGMEKSLEEQLKHQQHMGNPDMFPMDHASFLNSRPQQPQQQEHVLNQFQLSELARADYMIPGVGPYVPAHSPPTMFQPHTIAHPMPPRPRPEGGQDTSSSFMNENMNNNNGTDNGQGALFKPPNKKDDLVIDSWTGGPTPAAENDSDKPHQQQQVFNNFGGANQAQQPVVMGNQGGLEDPKDSTGWGPPPPTNPNGWAAPPPKIENWQQPPPSIPPPSSMMSGPPPAHNMVREFHGRGGYEPREFQGIRRGGAGRGDGYNGGGLGFGMRGSRGRGMSGPGYRGRGRGLGPPKTDEEREQEKKEGRMAAISKTVAMMSQMRMEDEERKDAHVKYEKERVKNNRDSESNDNSGPDTSSVTKTSPGDEEDNHWSSSGPPDRRVSFGRNTNHDPRFPRRGGRGGRGGMGRGGRGGSGMPTHLPPGVLPHMMAGGHPPHPAAVAAAAAAGNPRMFLHPPGMAPYHPGMDPFHQGMDQFFSIGGPGGPGGPFPHGFPGAGRMFPPIHFGGPDNNPRFPQGGQGYGRACYPAGHNRHMGNRGRGGWAGRGGNNNNNFVPKSPEKNGEKVVAAGEEAVVEKPAEESVEAGGGPVASEDVGDKDPDPDPERVDPSDGEDASAQQPKNVISGQGKGQLALSASKATTSKKSSGHSKTSSSRQTNTGHMARNINRDAIAEDRSAFGLRDRLIQQLVAGQTECMVCLIKIRPKMATWHCDGGCYQVFHIHCIKKWSKTSMAADGSWRCPGCQLMRRAPPREYKCFCGKVTDPPHDPREIPHSCGEVCGKSLLAGSQAESTHCAHKCVDLCHPGPCPPCTASVLKSCPCGKTKEKGKCGVGVFCDAECGKLLNCQVHRCAAVCHGGPCGPCDKTVEQTCYCPANVSRTVDCVAGQVDHFSCRSTCGRTLDCGNHVCGEPCHEGTCGTCKKSPRVVSTCHCGKTPLAVERNSCLDAVPSCGLKCGKPLTCGPVGRPHSCQEICHDGPCPACPLATEVKCRCGFMEKELACARLVSRADDARCEKKCSVKRSCLRHKCGQKCCIDIDHVCPLICGRLLSCGQHRCTEPCHRGNCAACPNVSFDELSCHCGAQVIYPPVACGVKPPECRATCTRPHPCGHPVMHSCHVEQTCPPCTSLTEKWCHGRHELRKSVACHIEGISCGKRCGKTLPCARHTCTKTCHSGNCVENGAQCVQLCTKPRQNCEHPCNAPCHEGNCPATPCIDKVKVKCECGNLSSTMLCSNMSSAGIGGFHSSLLAAQIRDLNNSNGSTSVNVKTNNKGFIDCNEECAKLERNRRLALALQIENPDSRLAPPKYSDFLKDMARREPAFAANVHEKLVELVKLAKESKQRSRSYSFDVMNREKRQFVHELSDHFGVDSESYDPEPKRNVVATAVRDKIWIPTQSIVEVVQGLRKAAKPMVEPASLTPAKPVFTTLQPSAKASPSGNGQNSKAKTPPEPIDYFEFDG